MLLEINNIKIKKSLKNLFFSDFFIFISISKLKEIKNNLLKFICKLIMKVGKFMEKITYFLCESNESSTEFYKKNLNFSKKVLNKLEGNFSNDINDYMNYINKNNMEQLRSKSEYLLEILMIGVFWKEHVNKAISLSKIPRNILIKLSTLREKESIKKIVDINRGLLEYLFLNRRSNDKVKISLENYKKLSMFGKKLFLRIFFIALIISIVFLIFAISPFSVHTSQFDNINFLLSFGIVALIVYCVLGTGRLDD